ncbi:MAG: methyltransferase domain-containing protein [Elusimicrobiota bacterium]|jgi:ubiquinone/menaquinone biosynthesis C-methylase UbiE
MTPHEMKAEHAKKGEAELPGMRPFIRDLRRPILDLIGPTYILDESYCLVDWNPAFEEIFAKEFGLLIGTHISALMNHMDDGAEVIDRSLKVFQTAKVPLVHDETLTIRHPRFGAVTLQKIAGQIMDEKGRTKAWSVSFNILHADRLQELWQEMMAAIEREIAWSQYAVAFDRVFEASPNGEKVLEKALSHAHGRAECLHVGVGTGTMILRQMKESQSRVWALEPNETLLEFFRKKLGVQQKLLHADYSQRLKASKGRPRSLAMFSPGHFDAVLMFDGHCRADDLRRTLEDCHRVLKKDGVLSWTTFSKETNFEAFFSSLKESLEAAGGLKELRPYLLAYQEALKRLDPRIRSMSPSQIEALLADAGFEVVHMDRLDFQGGCLSIKAVRAEKEASHASPGRRAGVRVTTLEGGVIDLEKADVRRMMDELLRIQARVTFAEDLKYLLEEPAWNSSTEILELGCGPGHFLANLARYFPQKRFLGVDADKGFVDSARKYYGAELSNASFDVQDLYAWRTERKFDYILLRFVAQHLPDHAALLERLKELLRPDGRVLVVDSADQYAYKFVPRVPALENVFTQMASSAKNDREAASHLMALKLMKTLGYQKMLVSSMGEERTHLFMNWFMLIAAVVRRDFGVEVDLGQLSLEFHKWKEGKHSYGHWSLEYLLLGR